MDILLASTFLFDFIHGVWQAIDPFISNSCRKELSFVHPSYCLAIKHSPFSPLYDKRPNSPL